MATEVSSFAQWFQQQGSELKPFDGQNLAYAVHEAAQELEAVQAGTLLADGGDRGWIEFWGADAADFLQRVLTSDVRKLQPGKGQWSAMLNGKGHWIADILLYSLPVEDSVPHFALDVPASRVAAVLQKLEMLHFGEDLHWQCPEVGRVLLLGPVAETNTLGLQIEARPQGWLLHRPDRGAHCQERILPLERVSKRAEEMLVEGAVLGGWRCLEHLRIAAFRPRWGADFDEETTLPNTNEWQRASLEKGCYAGQETIAKIHTYGQAPRQLVQLWFEGASSDLTGAELQNAEGRKMGQVTSWTWSEEEQAAMGLGILRRRSAVEGGEVFAVRKSPNAKPIGAVVHLPEKHFG